MADPDRHAIAARHRIPLAADQLIGTTAAELEADAAARATIAQAFGAPKPEERESVGTEPSVEVIEIPTDRPVSEFSEPEREAWLARVDETAMQSLERRDRARAEEVERREREAALSDAQRVGFAISDDASSKRDRDAAFLAGLHGVTPPESES